MPYVVAVVGGFAFGAADQYLGSRIAFGAWAATVSQMSAPWLVLPFIAGMTQERARRAMAVGLLVTAGALIGYFVTTCSPIEAVPMVRFSSCVPNVAFTGYNPLWIAGGMLFGPLYGLLGHRWRVARSWIGPALVAGTLCLEPLARVVAGLLSPPTVVWRAEIVLGFVVAIVFGFMIAMSRRARGALPRAG
ncbi:MAG TPA: hypothetical protein VHV50_04380 [Actinomycetota bacterium]|jgi:hypothetical protein|nr:hypothetical protein [Actinomycetota bacterium]